VVVVLAGQEPPNFLAHFQSWDSKGDDYTQKLRAIQAEEMALKMSGKKAIAKVRGLLIASVLAFLVSPLVVPQLSAENSVVPLQTLEYTGEKDAEQTWTETEVDDSEAKASSSGAQAMAVADQGPARPVRGPQPVDARAVGPFASLIFLLRCLLENLLFYCSSFCVIADIMRAGNRRVEGRQR
jgi:hypothetical protein